MIAYVRLAYLCEQTGEPVATIRAAVEAGEIVGYKLGRAWRVSVGSYNEWVETGKRGGNVGNPAFRKSATRGQHGRSKGSGTSLPDETGSAAGLPEKAKRPRGKRRQKPVIYDVRPWMDGPAA